MMAELEQTFLKGCFLLAMPGLMDPNFSKTVTCMCEHTDSGALGIVINRLHPSIKAQAIFDELRMPFVAPAGSIPIYVGGPVHMDELFILHGPPFGWQGSLMVSSGIAMSNTRDILQAIAQGDGPESFLIALGCAGWGPGQLESEVKANSWLTSHLFESVIFDTAVENRWESAVKLIGIDPSILSQTAGHA